MSLLLPLLVAFLLELVLMSMAVDDDDDDDGVDDFHAQFCCTNDNIKNRLQHIK